MKKSVVVALLVCLVGFSSFAKDTVTRKFKMDFGTSLLYAPDNKSFNPEFTVACHFPRNWGVRLNLDILDFNLSKKAVGESILIELDPVPNNALYIKPYAGFGCIQAQYDSSISNRFQFQLGTTVGYNVSTNFVCGLVLKDVFIIDYKNIVLTGIQFLLSF